YSSSSPPPPPQGTAFPVASQYPQVEFNNGWAGWKDRGFAIAFWIHFILVVVLGLALGIPAIRADAKKPYDDPTRTLFDYNADLFIRLFV
ncbi:unnamed protein product, partial [Rotaria sordida]